MDWIPWWCWSISWSLHFHSGCCIWSTGWVWQYFSSFSPSYTTYVVAQMSEYIDSPHVLKTYLYLLTADSAIIMYIPFWIGIILNDAWWLLWVFSFWLSATGCCSLDFTSWRGCLIGPSAWSGLLMLWVWYEGYNRY